MWIHHSKASPAQPGPGQSPPAVPVTHGPLDPAGLGSSLSRAGFQIRAAACGKEKGDRSHQEEAGAVQVPEHSCCSCPYREMTLGVDPPLQCPPSGRLHPRQREPLANLGGPCHPLPRSFWNLPTPRRGIRHGHSTQGLQAGSTCQPGAHQKWRRAGPTIDDLGSAELQPQRYSRPNLWNS